MQTVTLSPEEQAVRQSLNIPFGQAEADADALHQPGELVQEEDCLERFLKLAKAGRVCPCNNDQARAYNLASQHLMPLARATGAIDDLDLEGFFEMVRIARRSEEGKLVVLDTLAEIGIKPDNS
jgi:hypothetical protein